MSSPLLPPAEQASLLERWQGAWPQALEAWSRFTRLRPALLCETQVEAAQQGLQGSFAMIRLADQSVVIDLQTVQDLGLQDYGVEVLAHEIGHHILAPATAADQFRLIARIRRGLPTLEQHAPMIANLFTDLLINDRLQRQSGLRMADIYRRLAQAAGDTRQQARLWTLYLRIYEILWKLDKGELGSGGSDGRLEEDAWLGARLIRVYAGEWMEAAGRFSALLLPYLVADNIDPGALRYLHDTRDAAEGWTPSGMQDIDHEEMEGAIHPVLDPKISGVDASATQPEDVAAKQASGQAREPREYIEILRASGVKLSEHEIAIRYYRERALPHLIPFPSRKIPSAPEPQLEGLEPWSIGDPLDAIDWLQTVLQSPRPVPGLSTVQRVYGQEPGVTRRQTPIDLDLYVDSSGSMPNPQWSTSYLALAGAIIALSALRAGASVQVTLWSGQGQHTRTKGFVRDEYDILGVLTGFLYGGTCFPIHLLRDTYKTPRDRPTHILMLSDDGITTMFDRDEEGNSGWDIAAAALASAGAGGTMALNLPADWENYPKWQVSRDLARARDKGHWQLHVVVQFADLLEFARAFSRRHYAENKS